MCQNCGVNHDTLEIEDEGVMIDFMNLLFGTPVDHIAERGLKSDYDLFGSNEKAQNWKVSVALVPKDQVEEEHSHHEQWWALSGYVDGKLVVSTEGAPPEPVTAEEAAKIYAEYHFAYEID